MAFLTGEEMDQVRKLKEMGVLQLFKKEELVGITKNGGVSIFCGDGDIDARSYHKRTITNRPHSIMIFGGPLVFARSFRGYDAALAEGLLRNREWGAEAKHTLSVFLYFHWPCGVGTKFGCSMMEAMGLAPEVVEVFQGLSRNIHTFFHAKKVFPDGHEEQNTYKLILPKGVIGL